jgi:hypothetical protein
MAVQRALHARDVHALTARSAAVELDGEFVRGPVTEFADQELQRGGADGRRRATALAQGLDITGLAVAPDPPLRSRLANREAVCDRRVGAFAGLVCRNDALA